MVGKLTPKNNFVGNYLKGRNYTTQQLFSGM